MIDSEIIEALFPANDVPKTRYAGMGELRWFGNDVEDRYRAKPHRLLGPDDVSYRFNSYGYRGPEFSRGDVNIMALGDSFTFGTGLPEEAIYGSRLAKLLGERLGRAVRCWDLALGGHSNDFIARTALSAIPALKPDVVLAMFTGPARREYFAADGQPVVYVPNRTHVPAREAAWTKEAHRLLDGLASAYQDAVNLAMNLSLTKLVADAAGARFSSRLSTQATSPRSPNSGIGRRDICDARSRRSTARAITTIPGR